MAAVMSRIGPANFYLIGYCGIGFSAAHWFEIMQGGPVQFIEPFLALQFPFLLLAWSSQLMTPLLDQLRLRTCEATPLEILKIQNRA